MDHALAHGFERCSVVAERRLLATALKRGYGSVLPEEVNREYASRHEVIRRAWGEETFATTREVLAEEAAILAFARNGRGTCAPLRPDAAEYVSLTLNTDQEHAVRHVLASTDRVMLIRGAAGTGKTTLLKTAAAEIADSGREVHVFAPTTEASRGILRRDGFESADTVARLLADQGMQGRVRGQVIWVDEAGLLGIRDLRALFKVAEEQNARVVLMGDERQHGSVPRGDAFRLLQSHGGLEAAEVGIIRRQKGEYKKAVEAFAEGDHGQGFERLDRLGAIREVGDDTRHVERAAGYLAAVGRGKSALVVAPTHAEGRSVTLQIREGLKAAGSLSGKDRVFGGLTSHGLTEAMRADPMNFQAGDVVRFHQNARGGFKKGEALTVAGRNASGQVLVRRGRSRAVILPLDQAKHFDVYQRRELPLAVGDRIRVTQNGKAAGGKTRLINGTLHTVAGFTAGGDIRLEGGTVIPRDFGHLAHGYCTTSHAAQGKTVDHVFVACGPESFAAASREQFYVSVSRGRQAVTVYCRDKQELKEAVGRSAARPTATELTSTPQPVPPRPYASIFPQIVG